LEKLSVAQELKRCDNEECYHHRLVSEYNKIDKIAFENHDGIIFRLKFNIQFKLKEVL
jgi:hypothetical protein